MVMEYSIGEVSAILNISKDMIRYYEKQGAIHASRNPGNNYRTYESMEVFWLLEALQHKSWGIPISEITDIRNNRYDQNTEVFLRQKTEGLKQEISYKRLLADRLEQIIDQISFGRYNIGNFWVTQRPAVWSCHLVTGIGDVYDRITMSRAESKVVFEEKNIPFFDNGFTAQENWTEWEMVIRKDYADLLGLKMPESFSLISEETALCTHVDIGEIGAFDTGVFDVLPAYARTKGYRIREGAPMRGILIGRGYDGGRFHRIVRLYLPITDMK